MSKNRLIFLIGVTNADDYYSIDRPWAVGQNYFASSLQPCGKYLVCGLFEKHMDTLLPKPINALPNTNKIGDQ